MIYLRRISLSEHAKKLLYRIYQEYQFHKDNKVPDSYTSRTVPSHFLFSSSDNSQIISSIVELSSMGMIKFFSDNRIMIKLQAISYIEKQLAKPDSRNL